MEFLQNLKVEIDIKVKVSFYHNTSSILNRRKVNSTHRSIYDRILNNRDLISNMLLYKQHKLQKGGIIL